MPAGAMTFSIHNLYVVNGKYIKYVVFRLYNTKVVKHSCNTGIVLCGGELMDYPLLSPSQLSAFVEGLRKQAGYTQTQAGELLGISQQAYARIEKAPEKVSVERFMLILKLLQAQLSVKFTPGLKALPREAWLAKDSTHVHQRSLASEHPYKRNIVSKGYKSDPSVSTDKPHVIVKPTGKKSSW